MKSELLKPSHLTRKAVVYIRQSTPHQVVSNQESLRLQYALRQRARELGWHEADIFYRTRLCPTLTRIDAYVIRWARRKYKRLRRQTKGARKWLTRVRRANSILFAHWRLWHGNGRTSGAV